MTGIITCVGSGIGVLEAYVTTDYGNIYVGRTTIPVDCNYYFVGEFSLNENSVNVGEAKIYAGDSITATYSYSTHDLLMGASSTYQEQVQYECRSEDESIAIVVSNGDGSFTIQAIAPGVTTIHVDMSTESDWLMGEDRDNSYTTFTITVLDPNV